MDIFVILTFLATVSLILFLAIKKPYVTIGKHHLETYAVAALVGPLIFLLIGYLKPEHLSVLISGTTNPVTILIFFLSMVFISVYLDEVGFMEYCAKIALGWAHSSGTKLFFMLYAVVSFLTIFTSNDIIILTLTPFIYYFTKHAKLDPKPYLLAEFFAANTWSILLQIGNPTNVYLTTSYGISFMAYLKVMWLPAIVAGLLNLAVLYFIFRKAINKNFVPNNTNPEKALRDRTGAIIGVTILICCTLLLIISPYLNISMWQIAFGSSILLSSIIIVRDLFRGKYSEVHHVFYKMPWSVIPFIMSFFIMVEVLFSTNNISLITNFIQSISVDTSMLVFVFGTTSALLSNVMNNIPMTVMYTQLISTMNGKALIDAVYATVIGSNIGAYFTPFGALAGIMWMSILKHKKIDLSYLEFIKYGLLTGVIVLIGSLVALSIVL